MRLRLALVLAALALAACTGPSPTEPTNTRAATLVFVGAAPDPGCTRPPTLSIVVDGEARGVLSLPGELTVPLDPGTHVWSVGAAGPAHRFEALPGARLTVNFGGGCLAL